MLRMSEINETDHQAMQHMLTQASVDWDGLVKAVAADTDALLGGQDAVLIIDESAFAKKGEASAGVARQWSGRLGKVDNCQVGVFAALCLGTVASLIDTRLYLPRHWVEDGVRCKNAAIPEDAQVFHSKSALAVMMIDEARQRGVRFGYTAVDGGYGKEPAFLRELDQRHERFVADVHSDQRIYVQDPELHIPASGERGRPRTRLHARHDACRVDHWAAAQPTSAWQRVVLREGEKGMLAADYLHARIWLWDGEESQAHCWHLLVRREVGALTPSHYCLSNAPADTRLQELARVQAQRFFIEHSFRETKSECGLADYQVRRWDAWHHHMALVMLANLFLVKQKLAGQQQWPMLSFNDLVTAMAHLLPRRQLTADELATTVSNRHQRRQRAKESHSRRTARRLDGI